MCGNCKFAVYRANAHANQLADGNTHTYAYPNTHANDHTDPAAGCSC